MFPFTMKRKPIPIHPAFGVNANKSGANLDENLQLLASETDGGREGRETDGERRRDGQWGREGERGSETNGKRGEIEGEREGERGRDRWGDNNYGDFI